MNSHRVCLVRPPLTKIRLAAVVPSDTFDTVRSEVEGVRLPRITALPLVLLIRLVLGITELLVH